jgi:hypothetical protein
LDEVTGSVIRAVSVAIIQGILFLIMSCSVGLNQWKEFGTFSKISFP